MNAACVRPAVACLVVIAATLAACPASAEQEFTPVAAGVRYRKIGSYDKARLAEVLNGGLDLFMAGFDPSQASTM